MREKISGVEVVNGCVQYASIVLFHPASIILSSSINTLSCYEELFQFSLDLAASNRNHINNRGLN